MGSLGMGDGALTENSTGKLTGQVVAVTGALGNFGPLITQGVDRARGEGNCFNFGSRTGSH